MYPHIQARIFHSETRGAPLPTNDYKALLAKYEKVEQERDEAVEALKVVVYEMAALVQYPDKPNFMPALGNSNSSDQDCLMRAYLTARAFLSRMKEARK